MLTPLHLAVALPLKDIARSHFDLGAFILINCIIDMETVAIVAFGLDANYPLHAIMHTLAGATFWVVGLGFYRLRSISWWSGLLFGAWSHLLIDAICHHDPEPFWPLLAGNPLYLPDGHLMLSLVSAAVLTYYLARWVQSLRIAERLARWRRRTMALDDQHHD